MPHARKKRLLDRYADPLPIRSRGAYQLVSARREDGRACVVVLPGAGADRARVAEAFAEIERVHGLVDHPVIPKVSARGEAEGTPFLELDCRATLDGEDVIPLFADSQRKVPYEAGDGFIRSLRMALQAAHAAIDPRTGGPVCLGRLSLRNLLFDREGRWFLVGFGRNFPLERDDGELDGTTVFFAAPEVAVGGMPGSPMGDYVALLKFLRAFTDYFESPAPLRSILAGEVNLLDGELLKLFTWVELRVIAAPPSLRASLAEAVEVADRIRALLRRTPDPGLFASHLAGLIGAPDAAEPEGAAPGPGDAHTLTLGPDAEWVAGPDGTRHRPGRALRRIVKALVARHRTGAAPASVPELLEIGWPGERPIAEAGVNRVHVELNRLRRMGLRPLLERTTQGYRLVAGTRVVEAPAAGLVERLRARARG